MDHKKARISDALLILSRTWLYMTLGAFVLYFIVVAIEQNRITITTTYAYRVPIEHEQEESEVDDNG